MFTITPRGPFSLSETIRFACIDRDHEPDPTTGTLHLAFCRDGSWEPVAVSVTQDRDGSIGVDGPARDRAQIERILSLDVDAAGFADVGRRDPVIARLQSAAPGLRPPQIHSAYEVAVFCILTARRSAAQARHLRTALAWAAGTVLTVDGVEVTCLPPPSGLLDPDPVRGLDATRRERLTGIARAALDGKLDTAALAAQPPEQARTALEELPGIGPFSSAIITVRSLGHTDYLAGPLTELNCLLGSLYDLGHDATPGELDRIAAPWSPWRTWSQLHIRSVSPRLSWQAISGTR